MDISKELILKQVTTICQTEDFEHKTRMQDLLKYIVTEYIEGRENQIKGYSIGVDVFNQGDDFDPDHNALVRINVGRLRRLLKFYYLEKGLNDPIIIDIPKGKYIPYIYENTTISKPSTTPNQPVEKLPQDAIIRVLVVPLKNINGGDEFEFFIHGFSHELATSLSKFDDIQVSRYSNFDGKNTSVENLLLANHYIQYAIEGDFSVFRNKAQLKIRLTDTVNKDQIWGDSFTLDLDSDNLFEAQDQLANKIAIGLGAEYGHISKHKIAEVQELKNVTLTEQIALMHYYYYLTSLSEDAQDKMLDICQKSLALYPDSAIIQALLGNVYGNYYSFDYLVEENAYQKFGELIESAYLKKPNGRLIKAILAFKCFLYGEQARFMTLTDQELQNATSSPLQLGIYGLYLCLFGEWEKGIDVFNQIKASNLDFPRWLYAASCLYYYKDGYYEKALTEANLYQIQNFFWGPLLRAATLGQLNRITEAQNELHTLCTWRPDFKSKAELLIKRYIKQDSLANSIMEGLQKAGLE